MKVKSGAKAQITPMVELNTATGLSDPEDLDDASTVLEIDQAKSFNFRIDDADKAQANAALMASATMDAAYQLKELADERIATVMAAQAGSSVGADGTDKIFDGTTNIVTTELLSVKQALDENNVPFEGRWVVLPPGEAARSSVKPGSAASKLNNSGGSIEAASWM